jgi:hypothetical protein
MDNKYILFLFFTGGFNRQSFSFAVDLAIRKKNELILLTKPVYKQQSNPLPLSEFPIQSVNEDELYLHILDLKGYYLSATGKWKNRFPVNTVNHFITGDLITELAGALIEKEITDLVISVEADRDQLKLLADLDKLLKDKNINLWIFYKDGLMRKKKSGGLKNNEYPVLNNTCLN